MTGVRQKLKCKVYLLPEEVGGFSVFAANLPGAMSQGETEAEALKHIAEAIVGVIASHVEAGEEVPWSEVDKSELGDPATLLERSVAVHV